MTCSRINSIREVSDTTVTARRLATSYFMMYTVKSYIREKLTLEKKISMKTKLQGFCVRCLSGSAAPSGCVFMANGQDN